MHGIWVLLVKTVIWERAKICYKASQENNIYCLSKMTYSSNSVFICLSGF